MRTNDSLTQRRSHFQEVLAQPQRDSEPAFLERYFSLWLRASFVLVGLGCVPRRFHKDLFWHTRRQTTRSIFRCIENGYDTTALLPVLRQGGVPEWLRGVAEIPVVMCLPLAIAAMIAEGMPGRRCVPGRVISQHENISVALRPGRGTLSHLVGLSL